MPATLNPQRLDPTRLTLLRRKFATDLVQRFKALQRALYDLLVTEDALGIQADRQAGQYALNAGSNCGTGAGGFKPGNTCAKGGRGFGSVAEIEGHIVQAGLSGQANLAGLSLEEAIGVLEGLEAGLTVGTRKLKLRSVAVQDGLSEATGFGYSTRGEVLITQAGLANARAHDKNQAVAKYKDEPVGKRSFLVEDAADTQEYLKIAIAHETGHHAETALLLDVQRGVRSVGSLSESEILPLSGYATTHSVELFAELHAAHVTGRTGLLTPKLKTVYQEVLKTADSEGISIYVRNEIVGNTRWRFLTDADKAKAFDGWLKDRVDQGILRVQTEDGGLTRYIQGAYSKGQERSYLALRKGAMPKDAQALKGTFIGAQRKVSEQQLRILASRSYRDLQGITDAMDQQISRAFVDGLLQGQSPKEIAQRIADRVDKIGIARARTLVETELTRAHAEGALDAMEAQGVDRLSVAVEWHTTGTPCKLCAPLAGMILTVKEARGMFPRHARCRCTPQPVTQRTSEQKATRSRITKAIEQSLKQETPNTRRSGKTQRRYSSWTGAGKTIQKKRPKPVLNADCGTGKGGFKPGNTCAKGGRAAVTETPEFKAWFGNSKVVDDQGNPLVVYHGTGSTITEFDLERAGSRDAGFMGRGFYFTSDPGIAAGYASLSAGHVNVLPVYLSIQKPYVASERMHFPSKYDSEDFRNTLLGQGYDGAMFVHDNGTKEFVAFSPTQIKSAIGNRGMFDPDDPNILNESR